MGNSISVDIGFKGIKGDISQVLGSVKELNLGVKDVVLGMKGLNSETKELNKNVSENTFSKKLFKLRAYTESIKDFVGGFKSLYSEVSGLFVLPRLIKSPYKIRSVTAGRCPCSRVILLVPLGIRAFRF